MSLRECLRALFHEWQEPLSDATLSTVTRIQREREDSHAHAIQLAKESLGPSPFIVESYRLVSTAVWELEQQAKNPKPERKPAPIPMPMRPR